jgi:hypothetical protein
LVLLSLSLLDPDTLRDARGRRLHDEVPGPIAPARSAPLIDPGLGLLRRGDRLR